MAKSSLRSLGRVAEKNRAKQEPPTVGVIVITPITDDIVSVAVRALTPESDIEAVRDSLPENKRATFMVEAKIVAELGVLIQSLQMMGLPYGPGYIVQTQTSGEMQITDVHYTLTETGVRIKVVAGYCEF